MSQETTATATTNGHPAEGAITAPRWSHKLLRRIATLQPGRYQLIITIRSDGEKNDWTVIGLGSVEESR